jgi:hypothetical protein
MRTDTLRIAFGLIVAATGVVFSAAVPAVQAKLDATEARALLMRAGFDPRENEVAAITGLSQREAATKLVSDARVAPVAPLPAFMAQPLVTPRHDRRAAP